MKEHADKALSHKTKVLGKTVPTLLLIGLFLAGTGTAAVLTSFGTVTGQAEVTQAVTLNDVDADGDHDVQSYGFDDIVAGDYLSSSDTIYNNQNGEVTVDLESTPQGEYSENLEVDYMLLENGEKFSKTNLRDGNATASAEYVYHTGEEAVALHARTEVYDEFQGEISAGATFDVETEFTGSNTVDTTTVEGDFHGYNASADEHNDRDSPDWVSFVVEPEEDGDYVDSEEKYLLLSATADSDSYEVSSEDVVIFEYTGDHPEWEDKVADDQGEYYSELEGETITEFTVSTGTRLSEGGSGTESDLYYLDIELDGNSLMKSLGDTPGEVTLAPGQSELGTAAYLPLNAKPSDDYGLDTAINPPE